MKTQMIISCLLSLILIISTSNSSSQVQVNTNLSNVEMLSNLLGPGILDYSNVSLQGENSATGAFSDAASSLLGMETGIFLCTGDGNDIPGPNSSGSTSTNNFMSGASYLNNIATGTTYDAAVLAFDFIPQNDTLRILYTFGSEEYNENVNNIYNDVSGIFLTGPNPIGGYYATQNISIVPGTTSTTIAINNINNGWASTGVIPTGPCTNCEYYSGNTSGPDLEYDGFTTKILAWITVIPFMEYNLSICVADVN